MRSSLFAVWQQEARLGVLAQAQTHLLYGLTGAPAYHYEPETNGCIERFMGVLKEQVLWIERLDTHDALRTRVRQFARTYNQSWLLERHTYRTPIEAREHLRRQALVA